MNINGYQICVVLTYSLNMLSSGTESDSSTSSDVDFDDYGEFGYQLEPEYSEEELRQMEED
jgi:hypothetical protein